MCLLINYVNQTARYRNISLPAVSIGIDEHCAQKSDTENWAFPTKLEAFYSKMLQSWGIKLQNGAA